MSEFLRTDTPEGVNPPKRVRAKGKGKNKASSNALVIAQVTFMTEEDWAAYKDFAAGLHADLKPKGAHEEELLQTLAQALWTGNRLRSVQMNILSIAFDSAVDEWITPGGYRYNFQDLNILGIEEERAFRKFSQTFKELKTSQDNRRLRRLIN